MNTDRSFFIAYNDCGKFGIEAVSDPSHTRKDVIENIRRGELGFDEVRKVFEFNPAEGWSRDVTDDIFADVDAEVQQLKDLDHAGGGVGRMPQHIINGVKIRTDSVYPPIPDRSFDWQAITDDYDGAEDSSTRNQIGRGATEQEAINDLLDQLEDATNDGELPFPGHSHFGG